MPGLVAHSAVHSAILKEVSNALPSRRYCFTQLIHGMDGVPEADTAAHLARGSSQGDPTSNSQPEWYEHEQASEDTQFAASGSRAGSGLKEQPQTGELASSDPVSDDDELSHAKSSGIRGPPVAAGLHHRHHHPGTMFAAPQDMLYASAYHYPGYLDPQYAALGYAAHPAPVDLPSMRSTSSGLVVFGLEDVSMVRVVGRPMFQCFFF